MIIYCSNCNQRLEVPNEYQDQTVECPACNQPNDVPINEITSQENMEGVTVRIIDGWLEFLREDIDLSGYFEKIEKWLTKAGLLGLYASALLSLLAHSIILPIRYNQPYLPSIGLGAIWFVVFIVCHYIACKFLPALTHRIETTPIKMSSKAFLDSLALISLIAGVISLPGGFYLWIETASLYFILSGILIFIYSGYLLSLCLDPSVLNIEITDKSSPGQEFLGLISFILKGSLKLTPIIFGSGIIICIIGILQLLFTKSSSGMAMFSMSGLETNILYLGVLPPLVYLSFLIYYIVIDLAMAVLAMPGKLDALKETKK